jgi:assimilatory nitrate reductase catalytic subunit
MLETSLPDALREVRSVCPYCGTGCGVIVQARGAEIVGVRGDPEHPANFGKLCPKGQTLHLTARPDVIARSRLLYPELRTTRNDQRQRVEWNAALELAADRFASALRSGGPRRVGFYVSGQLLTEDYYAFNKLARALVGTNNIDSNSRLCMSSAVVAYKRTLGADAPPCCYEDLELADCVLIAGANPAVAHPVLFGRLLESRRRRGTQLLVVDPRRTETAAAADLHLRLAPGSDLYLYTAMLAVIMRDGLVDTEFVERHTAGFAAAADAAKRLPLAEAARVTGLRALDIERAARMFARAPATLSLWCQGLNQSTHGADNGAALIHLHLATGQIARPGAGPFSLTGQPNAMGGRETGAMATLLPGHRDPASADDRAEMARLWGIDALPHAPGKTAVELFEAAAEGEIDCLWIACTNPAQSMPDQALVRRALVRVPFVILQEAFANTETAQFADLLLPAATWGERTGTMTNSERRITHSAAAVPPPGQARADWRIARDFARKLARRIAPERAALFDWRDARAVFDEYKRLTAGRDLDVSSLDFDGAPTQWPVRNGRGSARLYLDRRFATADGRARFVRIELRTTAEATCEARPIALTTHRLRNQWHGGSRSTLVAALSGDLPRVELAVDTATAIGVGEDDLVRVETTRGALLLPVRLTDSVAAGAASIGMHFGTRWLPASAGVNALTSRAFDPLSRQPELKHAVACIERCELPWHVAAIGWLPAPYALEGLELLRARLAPLRYAMISPLGRVPDRSKGDPHAEPLGIIVLAAHDERAGALVEALRAVLALDADAPALADPRAGRMRCVRLERGRIRAVLLEGRNRADLAAWAEYRRLIETDEDFSQRSLRELMAPAGH